MRVLRSVLAVCVVNLWSATAHAAPIAIDFESLTDLEEVSTQFIADGVVFSGATALVSGANGGSLNEFDFPPASGAVVLFDSAVGGITINFLTPALSVAGLFTYVMPLTLTAYSGATVVGSVTSTFGANTPATGNPSNELLQFAYAGGISSITLIGDALGGSFVLDDFAAEIAESSDPAPVPEPATASLLLAGIVALVARRRRIRS